MSPRKRLACDGDCSGKTEHALGGENIVGRPVWVCRECESRRVGLFATVDVVEPAATTDGGVDE